MIFALIDIYLIYAQTFMVNKYTLTAALFDTGLDGLP
jgi:hypothetical protein